MAFSLINGKLLATTALVGKATQVVYREENQGGIGLVN